MSVSASNVLRQEIERLVKLRGTDNWSEIRDVSNFKVVERQYSFGKRTCLTRKEDSTYENLQSSRGIGIVDGDTIERILDDLDDQLELLESDWVRISEIEQVIEKHREFLGLSKLPMKGFVELGFRVPRLMRHYKDYGFEKSWGFDIAPLSLAITNHLGYDARKYDFDKCEEDLQLADADLIVSYHMLEHISDPLPAIKKIFESMKCDSYLHVEIPIEPGFPRVEFAHMFPFEPRDMLEMLHEAGFVVLMGSNQTHTGGPHIERYTAYKGSDA